MAKPCPTCDTIHAILDGQEWSSEHTLDIANVLVAAGYTIAGPTETTMTDRIVTPLRQDDWMTSIKDLENATFNKVYTNAIVKHAVTMDDFFDEQTGDLAHAQRIVFAALHLGRELSADWVNEQSAHETLAELKAAIADFDQTMTSSFDPPADS